MMDNNEAQQLIAITSRLSEIAVKTDSSLENLQSVTNDLKEKMGRILSIIEGTVTNKPLHDRVMALEFRDKECVEKIGKIEGTANKLIFGLITLLLTCIGTLISQYVLHKS